jgi:flagellin
VNRDTSKSLQRLSTGLRINTASDDAAGLGVSENLRSQVRGMQMAFRNTQDAISLLQIADGALNEQADILQRMREIIIQAKNDTYTQNERDYMFQEFSGLMGELDRIAAVTNYNGMQIFAAPEAEQNEGQTLYTSTHEERTPHQLRDARDAWTDPTDSLFGDDDYSSANHFNMMIGGNYSDMDQAAYDVNFQSFQNSASNMIMIQFGQMDANTLLTKDPSLNTSTGNASRLISDFTYSWTDLEDRAVDRAYNGAGNEQRDIKVLFNHLLKIIDGDDESIPVINFLRSNNGSAGRTHNVTGLARVNQMRANIGAFINRLDHASNNLLNQISNTQSAEAVIRDADFAGESATFSKNQILTQSSTAMLAQSNMVPQSVLQLIS